MRRNGSDSTKTEKKSFLKRNDIILIAVLVILAAIGALYFQSMKHKGAVVTIRVDDKVYGSYPLNEEKTISLEGEGYENTLVIKDGSASMIKADCPDQICVYHAPINKNGELIICLPHRIVVEVISDEESDQSDIDMLVK